MARIFIDGFESGDHDMWDSESNATVIANGTMDGDYLLDLNAGGEYLRKNITAAAEMYFSLLLRPMSLAYGDIGVLYLYNGATSIGHISASQTSGIIKAYIGASTLVATGTKELSTSTNYLIEVHIKIADSGGRFEVKIDGIQDIDFTGDTKAGADTQFDKVQLGGGSNTRSYFDNFIIDDANWIGDTNIQAVVPTGAGNTTGWTPSAGANWQCVDEKPANDADYVSINANDITDTYAAGNMIGTISDVKCVQVQSRAKTDGSPTPTNLKLVIRSGGTDYLSGNKAVLVAAKSLWNLWETNPADSAAWEEADVNAMEIGVKSAA